MANITQLQLIIKEEDPKSCSEDHPQSFSDSSQGMNTSDIVPPTPDSDSPSPNSWKRYSEPIDLEAEEFKAEKVAKMMKNNVMPSYKVKKMSHWTSAKLLPVTPIKPPVGHPNRFLFPQVNGEVSEKDDKKAPSYKEDIKNEDGVSN